MRERVNSPEGKHRLRLRQHLVEPIFGHLKHNWKFRDLLLRGKAKATGEFLLMGMAYNLKKMATWVPRIEMNSLSKLQPA